MAGLTAVVVAGTVVIIARAAVVAGLPGLPPLGRRLALKIFLFLQGLLKTVADSRQLHNPVA
ncbi:MAG: hypothetical protein HY550_02855 [Elusimicrobia bacterium]|nr:hypothetical protein [Elusimicrobiota bacterium]